MNNQLESIAREILKEDLSKCTEREILIFKRMYASGKLDKPINSVVNDMPIDKLDWAMQQVSNTLAKRIGNLGGRNEQKRTD